VAVPEIASVAYAQVQLGADFVARVSGLTFRGGAAWLAVTDPGPIASPGWYPGASAQGAFATVGAGYDLGAGFEVRLDLEGRLYFLDFHPAEGDPAAVAGATDRYLAAQLGVAWRMDPTGL
jgi:hypothetical protein